MTNLEEAKKLISDKLKWCKYTFAKDQHGNKCSSLSEYAVKFDASGACSRAEVTDEEYKFLSKAAILILRMIPGWRNKYRYEPDYPQVVNDDLGHEYVMRMFDIAIEMEREKNEE